MSFFIGVSNRVQLNSSRKVAEILTVRFGTLVFPVRWSWGWLWSRTMTSSAKYQNKFKSIKWWIVGVEGEGEGDESNIIREAAFRCFFFTLTFLNKFCFFRNKSWARSSWKTGEKDQVSSQKSNFWKCFSWTSHDQFTEFLTVLRCERIS